MADKIFNDGDDVLYSPVPGKPMKKYKIHSSARDKKTNEWIYKLKDAKGGTIDKVAEKQLTME